MKTTTSTKTIGLDLGDRKHAVCVLEARGTILKEESITNTRGSLTALSRGHLGALVVMEVGMQIVQREPHQLMLAASRLAPLRGTSRLLLSIPLRGIQPGSFPCPMNRRREGWRRELAVGRTSFSRPGQSRLRISPGDQPATIQATGSWNPFRASVEDSLWFPDPMSPN